MDKTHSEDLLFFGDESPFSRLSLVPHTPLPSSSSTSYSIPDLLSEPCQDAVLEPVLASKSTNFPPIVPLTPVIASLPIIPIAPKAGLAPLKADALLSFLNISVHNNEKTIAEEGTIEEASTDESYAEESTSKDASSQSKTQKEKLQPREYQIELYKKALDNNILAVMDTGSGKTLVAAMLIDEMAKRERETERSKGERKISFFIVNNIPLVAQQAQFIRDNSDCIVEERSGSRNTKKYNTSLWEGIFDVVDVVVTTAQYLLDLLRHAFVNFERIYLLVFDECHHARGDHPYGNLLKEFYHTAPKNNRPKIFGMTASPLHDNSSKLLNSTTGLEILMDSLIYSVSDDKLQPYTKIPRELVVQYNPSPNYDTTPLTVMLREHCGTYTKLQSVFTSEEPYILKHLGPWGVDRYWSILINQISKPKGFALTVSDEAAQASEILNRSSSTPLISNEFCLSPKVMKLVQLLRIHAREPDVKFCGIIFVERRVTAVVLCLLLQELDELKDCLNVQVLAGHSDESDAIMRMTAYEQNQIVKNFRDGEYNLLVATSVAEEGLDIQPCNFVLRFDSVTTTISHIQSKGRARREGSRYIVMREFENKKEEETHEKVKHSEKALKEWVKNLDPERPLQVDLEDSVVIEKLEQVYKVPSTGATLTLDSATALIHQYCTAIATDQFAMKKPEFKNTTIGSNGSSWFLCELTLPVNAPFRHMQSDPQSTKLMAKKSAAFKACEQLHSLGAFNDHLLPAVATTIEEEEESEEPLQENGKEKTNNYPIAIPVFWKNESPIHKMTTLFGCTVEFLDSSIKQRHRPIGILTKQPIPMDLSPFNVYIDGVARRVAMNKIQSPMTIKEDRLEELRYFTLSTFNRVSRKQFDCQLQDMPYFIVPLVKDYTSDLELQAAISWEDLSFPLNGDSTLRLIQYVGDQDVSSLAVIIRNDNDRLYYVKNALREYSINDVMSREKFKQENDHYVDAMIKLLDQGASESVKAEIKNCSMTFAQYFKYKFRVDCPDNDIVLVGERMAKMKNYLQPVLIKEETKYYIFPLSACALSPINGDVLRMALIIPSILYNLDAALLVHEVQRNLMLERVSLEHLQIAFTTSSASREYHYERLETLGDSFLKFATTIRLYIINPAKDEGQLHSHRIRIISNAALLRGAVSLELFKYICSMIFHRKSWRPIRFTIDGKKPEVSLKHNLSNKMLADVVEATMGAAYLSGGVRLGLEAAKALHVPFDEFASWDEFYNVYSQQSTTKVMDEERSRVTLPNQYLSGIAEMESVLGYTFKDKLLFFEALTHASYIQTTSVCYQRLEFLGDAILDFQVVRYYYEKYPNAPPGAMTIIKDASVNNLILGAISINLGLYKYVNYSSESLEKSIRAAVNAVERLRRTSGLKGEYWNNISMPKVLGDLVESTLGAVFVDSGFNFETVCSLFNRLIKPTLDTHVNFDNIIIHPNKELLERIQSEGCSKFKFEQGGNKGAKDAMDHIRRRVGLGRQEEQKAPQQCSFKIHDEVVATVTGVTMESARKEVSIIVLGMMSRDPDFVPKRCDCPKSKNSKNRHESVLNKYLN